ncbi:MAG: 50S ribosomal protein L24 [Candidatus Paceibacterota bacterium]|jgi:large subunit ribosomal protein L24
MKIKKGDNVILVTGKDRGKTGKVVRAMPSSGKVVVDGLNVMKRHEKARKQGTKGQTVSVSMPINVSNVMIVDPKSGSRSRVGKKLVGGKYVRIARKSGSEV